MPTLLVVIPNSPRLFNLQWRLFEPYFLVAAVLFCTAYPLSCDVLVISLFVITGICDLYVRTLKDGKVGYRNPKQNSGSEKLRE